MEEPQQRIKSGGFQGDGKGTDCQRIGERQERVDRVGRRTARRFNEAGASLSRKSRWPARIVTSESRFKLQ